ncbi:MAG: PDDEXK nuclease domain-containing protein [Deltaproteobacteria bacterium]|nr:PDDEXK nuclease domain-containing protein [Deltaproteobacteria bacterium]
MGEAVKHTPVIYGEIKAILESARSQAFRAVNFAMVQAYWNIGRVVVEEEQRGKARAGYGEYLLQDVSERLTKDFGKGFDYSNLKNMRQFYLTFPIGDALRSQLSWTHYRLLMRVEKESAREFYLEECISSNWSTRQLERQINSFYYERLLASRDRKPVKAEIHEVEPSPTLEDIIRDPYVLEFLNLKDTPAFREKELESALIGKLQEFMLELGKGFSFVARQKRFTFDGQHFFIDLVFYNYMLKCFVLIDLKVGTLSHQDLGQMQMYVNYYTREMRNEGDNPPIGIILCADKSDAVVRYTLPEGSKQIFASRYKLYLPTEEELRAEIIRDRDMIERERRLRE